MVQSDSDKRLAWRAFLRTAQPRHRQGLHVGADGLGIGRAIRSTELARLASAARAGLGAR
jgi:hypothetical protein